MEPLTDLTVLARVAWETGAGDAITNLGAGAHRLAWIWSTQIAALAAAEVFLFDAVDGPGNVRRPVGCDACANGCRGQLDIMPDVSVNASAI